MTTTEFINVINFEGATQTAKLSGMPKTTIKSWLYEKRSPTLLNAEKILKALGYELKIVKKEGN